MGYNIGPKIGIDGEKEFRQQIRNINDSYKALEAETRAVVKAFDAQGDEQGKLEALSKQLNKQIEEQRKKQTLLEDAVAKASAKFGEGSLEATRLRGALYDTQATISNLETELSDVEKQLSGTAEEMEDLEASTEKAADSALSFRDVMAGNLIADLTMDALREAASFLKEFASGSLDAAANMIAADAQFEQSFGELQKQASASLQQISDDTNIATTRMQGSFTKIYAFAKTAGADSSEALMIASRAMAAASDSAAYYDRSIEETTESLQAFLKGNYANDAALGISATETSRNTMANQLYAKSFKELTEAQKVDTLLAMVEAGNKASGALGQAARESDSWGNVMGELSEMFRQLQAEAGKPALKALTPTIQRITKAGYKLIEDIDWDRFGKTLEKILTGAIKTGPAIVRFLSALVAGFAAVKAVNIVTHLIDTVHAFTAVGQAASTTASAVAASGAAAMATPWGLVAGIIGAAVGYISMACMQAEETKTEFEKITEDLDASFDSLDEAYKNSVAEIDGAANSVIYYVERLKKLEAAGLDTAEAQKEYANIVAQINQLMPELNLQIDEQTGLLAANAEAVLADVETHRQRATVKALYEKLNGVIGLQAETFGLVAEKAAFLKSQEGALAKRTEQLEQAQADLNRATDARLKKEEELYAAEGESLELKEKLSRELKALGEEENALTNRVQALQTSVYGLENTVEAANEEVEAAKAIAAGYEDEIFYAQQAIDYYAQSTHEAAIANSELSDEQFAVKTALENLGAAYSEAEAAARVSIDSQIGLFDELTTKSDWSAEKIIKNWQSQREAFARYSDNLAKAVDMGLDKALVQQLSDGSVESMQILDALVNDTDTNIDEINKSFSRTDQARADMAAAMAAVQTDTAAKFDAIVANAKQAGLNIAAGAGKSVKDNSWRFTDEIASMAKIGQDLWNRLWDIHSPSRWMGDASEDIVAGGADNIKRYSSRFADAMAGLAQSGQDAFLQKKLDVAVSYPDMVAASTIHNSRTVTNMGGFTINIAQQPGESAESLAYRCMEIIQAEVEAEGAVFGAR